MSTKLQLTLLGKPEVTLDGVPLEKITYQKSLALLFYLAVTARPHSREALAGLLWGEATEANARAGLRKSLSELRKLLGGHLIIEHHQVRLDQAADYTLDVERLESHVEPYPTRGESALPPEEADILALALETYQGDFLSGFHVHRAAAFEEWATLQREHLRLKAIKGLHLLANHYLAHGEYSQAIRHVERLLALEPCQEEAHRQLISLLALNGQRRAALRQYEDCRRLLRDTLGVTPQPETTALYRRIKDQSAQNAQSGEQGQGLPLPLTPLIGREAEIAGIEARLAEPTCRLLTVLGPGGSGKTHLALAVGTRLIQAENQLFPDGVTFVPLHPLQKLTALPAALMHHLGFHFHKNASPIQQLQEQLAPQQRLIILDNFEHLLGAATGLDLLPQLLQSAPDIKILITSRVRLNVQGEHILPLDGIAYPAEKNEQSPRVETFPAVELFIQRARQVAPAFDPDPAARADIACICRQVEGLPLGILLAADWSRLLSPAEIAARLAADAGEVDTGIDFLETEGGDLPSRHRSLQGVFVYSWNLLTPQERSVLAALSIFPGSFTLAAAQEVSSARLRDLGALVDHSLVQRDASGRYQLHQLLRQFAHQEIADLEALQARYGRYYAARLAQWGTEIQGANQRGAIETLDQEIDNARLAWDWIVENGKLSLIDQAMAGLCLYYDWRHRYPDGYTACEDLVNRLDNLEARHVDWDQSDVNRMLAKALTWQSVFAPNDQTEALLRRGLACLDDPATDQTAVRWERAFCTSRLAGTLYSVGDTALGRKMYTCSIELFEALGDRWGLANALNTLGEIFPGYSTHEEAANALQRGLELHRALGDQRGSATALMGLGIIALFQGQINGEHLVRESLALYNELDDRVSMSEGFYQAILAMLVLGRYEDARSLLEEKNAIDKGHGLRQDATHVLLADTLIITGNYEEARFHAQKGLELARRMGDTFIIGAALVIRGWLALADGVFETACDLFQECAEHCRTYDQKDLLSWALAFLSFAQWRSGQSELAQTSFSEALGIAVEIESFVGTVFALTCGLPVIAKFHSIELALACYAAVSGYPTVSNAKFFDDLIGGHVAALKSGLSPEAVAQAATRGRELGLEGVVAEVLGGPPNLLETCPP
jgi:DNA-binding SARP family transcriptional activator/predicted ATPase